jgi:hypothetical protein
MRRLLFAEGGWRRFCQIKHNRRIAEKHPITAEAFRKIYDRGKCGRSPGGDNRKVIAGARQQLLNAVSNNLEKKFLRRTRRPSESVAIPPTRTYWIDL